MAYYDKSRRFEMRDVLELESLDFTYQNIFIYSLYLSYVRTKFNVNGNNSRLETVIVFSTASSRTAFMFTASTSSR